jgi:cellulose binding protein with CBM2 domain
MNIRLVTWRVRYATGAAAVVLALGGAGAALAFHDPAGPTHTRADVTYCGLVACAVLHTAGHSAGHSGGGVAIGAPADMQRAGGTRSGPPDSAVPMPSASAPKPAGSPNPGPPSSPGPGPTTPVPAPAPAPTAAGPNVSVSYSTLQRWPGGFMGGLRLVNNGPAAVSGWQLVITLGGDRVDTVWNADWQPGSGGSVIMTPVSYDPTIAPGASLSVNFVAQGGQTEPGSCTFDGSACS